MSQLRKRRFSCSRGLSALRLSADGPVNTGGTAYRRHRIRITIYRSISGSHHRKHPARNVYSALARENLGGGGTERALRATDISDRQLTAPPTCHEFADDGFLKCRRGAH